MIHFCRTDFQFSKGLRITTAGPKADIYVFTGSVLENMEEYTALTNKE